MDKISKIMLSSLETRVSRLTKKISNITSYDDSDRQLVSEITGLKKILEKISPSENNSVNIGGEISFKDVSKLNLKILFSPEFLVELKRKGGTSLTTLNKNQFSRFAEQAAMAMRDITGKSPVKIISDEKIIKITKFLASKLMLSNDIHPVLLLTETGFEIALR